VLWAAEHGVRELNVGGPAVTTRIANSVAPGLLDRYLGRHGIDSQQTDGPVDHTTRQDNLDKPVDDDTDAGAHGRFDQHANTSSLALAAATHKPSVRVAAVGTAAVACAAVLRRSVSR
jgi:hypothetical protein